MVKCKHFLCLLIGLGLLPCGFAMRPVDSLHLPDSLKTVYETVVDGKEPDMESLIGLWSSCNGKGKATIMVFC